MEDTLSRNVAHDTTENLGHWNSRYINYFLTPGTLIFFRLKLNTGAKQSIKRLRYRPFTWGSLITASMQTLILVSISIITDHLPMDLD